MAKGFWFGILRKEDHLEDPGVEGGYYWEGSSESGIWGFGLDRAGSG